MDSQVKEQIIKMAVAKKSYKEIKEKFPKYPSGMIRAYKAHVTIGTYKHGHKIPATELQKGTIIKLAKKEGMNSKAILCATKYNLSPQQVAGVIAQAVKEGII